jgi:hypothetical protein
VSVADGHCATQIADIAKNLENRASALALRALGLK